MSFSQDSIIQVHPPIWTGSALHLEWTSSAPEGTVFQVYADRRLTWHGVRRWVDLPMPTSRVRFDVGSVGPEDAKADFSALLPPSPQNRVQLTWLGGTYLVADGRDDLAGFRIYGEKFPGGGVDFSTRLVEITAYPGGLLNDGYGLGGFGEGGFGRSASRYAWTSSALGNGLWTFAIVPFDFAGNEGAPMTAQAAINAPPSPPPPNTDGDRLTYSYDPGSRWITLNWLPSPD